MYPKETKSLTQKDTRIPIFKAALFTTAKVWKHPVFITDKWILKVAVHTMEYYSPIKKEILPYVVTEIDTEVKTQMLYNLTYIWI